MPQSRVAPSSTSNSSSSPPVMASAQVEPIFGAVLQFSPSYYHQRISTSYPPQVLGLMQNLAILTHSLQNTAQSLSQENLLLTPETLLPYISDEAYDLLEALQDEIQANDPEVAYQNANNLLPEDAYITLTALVPRLLWGTMQASYRAMRLLEGISVNHQQPNQTWHTGLLRLVVLLNVKLPDTCWSFDLATGRIPSELIPVEELQRGDGMHFQPIAVSPVNHLASDRLYQLAQHIQTITPLAPWFEGIPINILLPAQSWQTGELKLRLGFEFTASLWDATSSLHPAPDSIIDAELLDDATGVFSLPGSDHAATTRVSIQQVPHPLNSTTLIRLCTEPAPALAGTEPMLTPAIARVLSRATQDPDGAMLSIATAAWLLAATVADVALPIKAVQPTPLMQELIPRLLWFVTRTGYEVLQLSHGIGVQVLQPGQFWQRGMLRLLTGIRIHGVDIDCTLNLATGQPISTDQFLCSDTICQQIAIAASEEQAPLPLLQHPTPISDLLHHLQLRLQASEPLVRLLQGVAIEWVSNQDWQAATASLVYGLELLPEQ